MDFGGVAIKLTPYVALKDGTIYKGLNEPPDDLEIEKSRRQAPERWGRWQKSGKTLIVQWDDGKRQTSDYYEKYSVTPAQKTDRLNGYYLSLAGGSAIAGISTFASNEFTFLDDGRFTHGKVFSGSSPSTAISSSSNSSGTYALDGYTIELQYADGKKVRQGFYFYPSKDQDTIGIGNSHFVRKK
jgi:hypothetical protein